MSTAQATTELSPSLPTHLPLAAAPAETTLAKKRYAHPRIELLADHGAPSETVYLR